ncbi:MAG: hypothetical protein ABI652_02310 [Acidobacteriota bacterium]
MRLSLGMLVRKTLTLIGVALSLVGACSRVSAAQGGARYALLVQGASGEEQYATLHRGWLDSLAMTFRDKFKYDAAHLTVLAEQPKAGEQKATAESVKAAFERFATQLTPSDQLAVVLIGHGGGQGADAKFNLIGPDLSVSEWATLLKPVRGRLIIVDTTSASFAYLAGLAAPNRIVITATNRAAQQFHTVFAQGFVGAFSSQDADADKNGRTSLLEAFNYASRVVKQSYEQKGTMATETAAIDDTGEGTVREATAAGPNGASAALTYFDAVETPATSDPELARLFATRASLTEQIDDLRRRRTSMPAADYDKEFERLTTELAVVSRDVRRKTGG